MVSEFLENGLRASLSPQWGEMFSVFENAFS